MRRKVVVPLFRGSNMRKRCHWPGSRAGVAIAMLTLLTQISCSGVGGLRAADDHRIVPDTRIGPFKLGMTDQELFQVGTPSDTQHILGTFSAYWFNDRVVYVNLQSRRVERIVTMSGTDRTSSGIGVGSSVEDLFRAFGPPDKTIEGDANCGGLGRLEKVLYQSGDMLLSFLESGASCAEAPTKRVQYVVIKSPGSLSFG
jgi:hypothetical protein